MLEYYEQSEKIKRDLIRMINDENNVGDKHENKKARKSK
jgi:hypothetical protein